jgi:hypothetical protein
MPAESLLAVTEVKSTLTKCELRKCFDAAKPISRLRSYKGRLSPPPVRVVLTPVKENIGIYIPFFAYSSDLTATDWLSKEAARIRAVGKEKECAVDVIDR